MENKLLEISINELTNKVILITGATGFIGANLTRYLANIGCNVHIITRTEKSKWRIQDLLSQVKEHDCDLRDHSQVDSLIANIKPDIIYHLAAYGSYPLLQQDFNTIVQVNTIGTLNLITSLSKVGYDVLVNSGSSSEYGLKTEPMSESNLLEPINHYGASKAATSLFSQVFAKQFSQPIITIRPFSVYGYYEEPTRLIPSVITSCLRGKEINLTGGEQVRDFIFIDDVVDAYLKASLSPEAHGEIINIGSGKQYSVKGIVSKISELCDDPVRAHWGALQYRTGETNCWVADISKAKRILDWEPQTDLSNGLLKTIEWFKKNLYLYGA